MMTLEEYKKFLGDESLTEEQVNMMYEQKKREFNESVEKVRNEYDALDMDKFMNRIGGQKTVDAMNQINEKLNSSVLINGKLVPKKKKVSEDLEEWKRGFMDGFEEAYKRLKGDI